MKSPNHSLQQTAPAVTLAASAALPPTVQPARQPPQSLSLGRSAMKSLETPRLKLVPSVSIHAPGLFEALRHPRIYERIATKPPASAACLVEKYARLESRRSPDQREHWLNWSVALRNSESWIGVVQATILESRIAQLAYLFSPFEWRKGYASEACREVVTELFGGYDVIAVEATADTENSASEGLLRRLGFKLVEERPSTDLIGGMPTRERLFRLTQTPNQSLQPTGASARG
jgi:ribosomal-protein-alanine N-acetyltransferase